MSTVGEDDEDPSQIFSQQAVALQDEDGSQEEVSKEDGNGKDGSTPDMQGQVASLATQTRWTTSRRLHRPWICK
jgi:hypothetical protein